jgi:SAM-dependent methyltransferase
VLDIGAGRGHLQDIVEDYTALDISPSARRFFHKPFVHGSATLMPLPTNDFDAAWSIWVLEHVPNPEAALVEMRRVIKNGGLLYLSASWDCSPYLANGYDSRPYRDFGLGGKLLKLSLPAHRFLSGASKFPIRMLRRAAWQVADGPRTLRYHRLTPNYEQYWESDSDAVNSLDRDETALWFQSRGDECLNCRTGSYDELELIGALIIRIHK